MWFQNRRSKDKRDASYRDAMRDEPSNHSTPAATPPLYPQSPIISTSLPCTTVSTPIAPSPSSVAQGIQGCYDCLNLGGNNTPRQSCWTFELAMFQKMLSIRPGKLDL